MTTPDSKSLDTAEFEHDLKREAGGETVPTVTQAIPFTPMEAKFHDSCDRCRHAAYWIRGEAKCNCSEGPVKFKAVPSS
jgi:hypothetical protein